MASHHRRKALQHLRITSGRTVLRRLWRQLSQSAAAGGRSAEVGRSSSSTSILRQWRINQWRGGFSRSSSCRSTSASGASAVSVAAAAGSASVKGGKPAVSSDVTAAVATAVSSAKLVKRQYTGFTAAAQGNGWRSSGSIRQAAGGGASSAAAARAAAGRAAQADLTAGSVAAGSSYSNGITGGLSAAASAEVLASSAPSALQQPLPVQPLPQLPPHCPELPVQLLLVLEESSSIVASTRG